MQLPRRTYATIKSTIVSTFIYTAYACFSIYITWVLFCGWFYLNYWLIGNDYIKCNIRGTRCTGPIVHDMVYLFMLVELTIMFIIGSILSCLICCYRNARDKFRMNMAWWDLEKGESYAKRRN